MPELYERIRVETPVISTGANGRCDECGHLHNLYRKRGEGSRRLCAYCINAGALRRVELDSELRAMGARIIQVKDLGAALEAREKGGQAITLCRGTVAAPAARVFARHAASLARLALGDAS